MVMIEETNHGWKQLFIIGVATAVSGILISLFSRKVVVEKLGTFEWHWIALLGMAVIVLGLSITIAGFRFSKDRSASTSFISLVLNSFGLFILGYLMLNYSSPMFIEGLGSVRGFWLGLVGVWFIFLGVATGLIALALKLLNTKFNDFDVSVLIPFSLIVAEGIALMRLSAPFSNSNFYLPTIAIIVIGAQLVTMGSLLIVILFITVKRPSKVIWEKIILLILVVLAFEAFLLIGKADDARLGDYAFKMIEIIMIGIQLAIIISLSFLLLSFTTIFNRSFRLKSYLFSIMILLAIPIVSIMSHL
ncbi:MAG: hypothetical protein QW520_06680 [Methanomassiliicoccales archaeon]